MQHFDRSWGWYDFNTQAPNQFVSIQKVVPSLPLHVCQFKPVKMTVEDRICLGLCNLVTAVLATFELQFNMF